MKQNYYKQYLLAVLTLIGVFSFTERTALGLVLNDIKVEFDLSDSQLGLLGGLAFAFFYSVMGVPIARWADRGNRVMVISATVGLWGVAVTLCAAAGTFFQLLLIRTLVAVGEAGCTPPAFSLIADNFSRAERPRAAAIYGMAAPVSTVVGFFVAGWLNQVYGWRVTFILLGLPGLGLAILAWLTLKEPRRAVPLPQNKHVLPVQPSLKEVLEMLWRNKTFQRLLLGFSVASFFINGIFVWIPTFVMRSYGLTTAETGMWLAGIWGVCGMVGAYLGGALATRYAANNERLQLRMLAIVTAISGALSAFAYVVPSQSAAFVLIGASTLGLAASNGPVFALLQTLIPDRMRAVSIALTYLVANLIGWGLGPLAAGALSDVFRPWLEQESLRYALLVLSPGYLLSAWYVWRASKTVVRDLAVLQVDGHGAEGRLNLMEESAHVRRL